MKRLAFLVTVPWFVALTSCGSGGDTQPLGAGGSGGGGGSSNAGGSKSGGTGGSGTSGSGTGGSGIGGSSSAGSGSGGSSGGAPSSSCALGCEKLAQLDCPNDNPATCPADCAARDAEAHELYPDCIAEYDAVINCISEAPISEWVCNASGTAGVGAGNCTEETTVFAECIGGG